MFSSQRIFCFASFWLISLGCSESSSRKFVSVENKVTAEGIAADLQSSDPLDERLAALRQVSFKSLYRNILESAQDEPVAIGGRNFSGLRSQAIELEPVYQRLDDEYGSIGAYFDEQGHGPARTLKVSEINSLIEKAWEFNQAGSASSVSGLYLATPVKCDTIEDFTKHHAAYSSDEQKLADTACAADLSLNTITDEKPFAKTEIIDDKGNTTGNVAAYKQSSGALFCVAHYNASLNKPDTCALNTDEEGPANDRDDL